jgi:hypothetical protein
MYLYNISIGNIGSHTLCFEVPSPSIGGAQEKNRKKASDTIVFRPILNFGLLRNYRSNGNSPLSAESSSAPLTLFYSWIQLMEASAGLTRCVNEIYLRRRAF